MTSINEPSGRFRTLREKWDLALTLRGGTQAMRKKGELYLPRDAKESMRSYLARLNRSFLYNIFGSSIKRGVSKVFSQDIQVNDVDPQLEAMLDNIDLQGRDISQFARDVFEDAVTLGITYIYVDYPTIPEGATLADELAIGARPYCIHIPAQNVLEVRSHIVAGRQVCNYFRFLECFVEYDPITDEEIEVTQVKILRPGNYTCWRQLKNETNWVITETGPTTLGFIPVVPVYANRTSFFEGVPPLADQAEVNLALWQSMSDQRNILHVCRASILFMKGNFGQLNPEGNSKTQPPEDFEFGLNSVIQSNDVQSEVRWVIHDTDNVRVGAEDCEELIQQTTSLGLELFVADTRINTATEVMSNRLEAHSVLKSMALNLKDSLEIMLTYMSAYLGNEVTLIVDAVDQATLKTGTVQIQTEFGMSSTDVNQITSLLEMVKMGVLKPDALLREAARRDIIASGEDLTAILGDGPPKVTAAPAPAKTD